MGRRQCFWKRTCAGPAGASNIGHRQRWRGRGGMLDRSIQGAVLALICTFCIRTAALAHRGYVPRSVEKQPSRRPWPLGCLGRYSGTDCASACRGPAVTTSGGAGRGRGGRLAWLWPGGLVWACGRWLHVRLTGRCSPGRVFGCSSSELTTHQATSCLVVWCCGGGLLGSERGDGSSALLRVDPGTATFFLALSHATLAHCPARPPGTPAQTPPY